MGAGMILDGALAAKKLSASLGAARKAVESSPQAEWDTKAKEGPQEAPGPVRVVKDGPNVIFSVSVPLEAFWAILKGVTDGK